MNLVAANVSSRLTSREPPFFRFMGREQVRMEHGTRHEPPPERGRQTHAPQIKNSDAPLATPDRFLRWLNAGCDFRMAA
jgi:hypothetical protein